MHSEKHSKVQGHWTDWEEIFVAYTIDKSLISLIYKELLTFGGQGTRNLIENGRKTCKTFHKKYVNGPNILGGKKFFFEHTYKEIQI